MTRRDGLSVELRISPPIRLSVAYWPLIVLATGDVLGCEATQSRFPAILAERWATNPSHRPKIESSGLPVSQHRRLTRKQWSRLRRRILERDRWRCSRCSRAGRLEVDHRQPVSRGGSNDPSNLQTLCVRCHRHKSRAEYLESLPPEVAKWVSFTDELRYNKEGAPTT